MKASEIPLKHTKINSSNKNGEQSQSRSRSKIKSPFRRAKDDTKPVLHDPILRSDPIETEEAVLRLPPFSGIRNSPPNDSGLIDHP